jgi:hypothetical protein
MDGPKPQLCFEGLPLFRPFQIAARQFVERRSRPKQSTKNEEIHAFLSASFSARPLEESSNLSVVGTLS